MDVALSPCGHPGILDSPSITFSLKAAEVGVQGEGGITGHRWRTEQLCSVSDMDLTPFVSSMVVACSSANNILMLLLLPKAIY